MQTLSFGQDDGPAPVDINEQVEDLAAEDIDTEDDSYLQDLEYYRKHPLKINEVGISELRELRILTDLQIQNFIQYRTLLGAFQSLYELQAIPTWDLLTIRKLLPYLLLTDSKNIAQHLKHRMENGDINLMLRFSMLQQKSKGFKGRDSSANHYLGSRPAIFIRYRYNYKNILQYGVSGDKDAGEQFFQGAQKQGFDFYSFHLFARKLGIIKSLALGDFTINMGQGLTHWQSLAFKKSSTAISIKRQSEVVRPYNSSSEYNFHRGAALTLLKNKWELSVFFSSRRFSASTGIDTGQYRTDHVSSILISGHHRTPTEIRSRNNLQCITLGGNIQYNGLKWHHGLNIVSHNFSKPLKPADQPYDLFGVKGNKWSNFSFDYSYTVRNIHVFGEIGIDKNLNTAILNGIIASIDRNVDISLLQRNIAKRYQSISGNAFTENSLPTNEQGIYAGLSLRPLIGWKMDAYVDVFKFPWLKFSTDAPGYGNEYLLQSTFSPNKRVEIYIRYKKETKQLNVNNGVAARIENMCRQSLRMHISHKLNTQFHLSKRLDLLWYRVEPDTKETGYLLYLDIDYKSSSSAFSLNTRLQYFETDGFNSRLFAYENDGLHNYSIPAFFDKGFRWYLNIRTDVSHLIFPRKKTPTIELLMKYAITRYPNLEKIGSGLAEIEGNTRSEYKVLLLFSR
jgi:hypothetical protein